jgi:hypothetical protein
VIVGVLDPLAAYTAPQWAWTATTVIGALVTLALIGILAAHVLLAAISETGPNKRDLRATVSRRSLVTVAVPLLALLLLVILVRFGFILAERPGR